MHAEIQRRRPLTSWTNSAHLRTMSQMQQSADARAPILHIVCPRRCIPSKSFNEAVRRYRGIGGIGAGRNFDWCSKIRTRTVQCRFLANGRGGGEHRESCIPSVAMLSHFGGGCSHCECLSAFWNDSATGARKCRRLCCSGYAGGVCEHDRAAMDAARCAFAQRSDCRASGAATRNQTCKPAAAGSRWRQWRDSARISKHLAHLSVHQRARAGPRGTDERTRDD